MDPADFKAIDSEIRAGLPRESVRLEEQARADDFYHARFKAYDPREHDKEMKGSDLPRRTAPIMRAIVQALGRHLYAKGPARALDGSPAATEWLNSLYVSENADGLFQEADRQSFVGEVVGVEAYDTHDPARRVGLRIWPAHQLVVWEDPDDAARPRAVGTLDYFDNRRRLRVWTDTHLHTYTTDKLEPGQTEGGTRFKYAADPEPHQFGRIPVAFIHCNPPTTEFWSGCPGPALVELNEYVNTRLTMTGDNLRFAGNPITVVFGVGGGWRPDGPLLPGTILYPTPDADAGGSGPEPRLDSFSHDLETVGTTWEDLSSYADLVMECTGVPPAAIRLVQGESPSGVAIVMEQLPLVQGAEARQRPFNAYERDIARVALAVGSKVEGRPDLDPALANTLTLRYPSMVPPIPLSGKDQDDSDDRKMARGDLSLIQVVMREHNLTRAQAVAHIAQVRADRDELARILGATTAASAAVATVPSETESENSSGQKQQSDQGEQPEPEPEPRGG